MKKDKNNLSDPSFKTFIVSFLNEFMKAAKESPALYFKPLTILFSKKSKKDS